MGFPDLRVRFFTEGCAMTAIGLVLIILSILVHAALNIDRLHEDSWQAKIFYVSFLVGVVMFVVGLIVWIWNNLP